MAKRQKYHQWKPILFFILLLPIIVLTVFFVSQKQSLTEQRSRASGGISFEEICSRNGTTMTALEALAIAQSSVCTTEGYITSAPFCNADSTGGWQMELSMKPSANKNYLCHPVCIVSASRVARIDYRCSDTKPPDSTACKRTGCNGEVCVQKDAPSLSGTCVIRPEHTCIQNFATCTLKSDGQCGFSPTGGYSDCMNERGCGWCGSTCVKAGTTGCTGTPPSNTICVLEQQTCVAQPATCRWCDGRCLRRSPTEGTCTEPFGPPGLLCTEVSGTNACAIKIDPAYTPTPTPSNTPSPTISPKQTNTPTPLASHALSGTVTSTPTPSLSPTPTPIQGLCDASCQGEADCADWMNCYTVENGVKRCRKPECPSDNTCCRYPSITPTSTPTPTSETKQSFTSLVTTTPSLTPTETPLFTITPTGQTKIEDTSLRITALEGEKTVSPTFPVVGTAAPNATVIVSVEPDGITQTVSADADGSWRFTFPQSITPGLKTIVATAKDSTGQEEIKTYTFTVKGSSQFPWIPAIAGVIIVTSGIFAIFYFRKTRA